MTQRFSHIRLDDIDLVETDGVAWSLGPRDDLDMNLVKLGHGGYIGEHIDAALDVIVHVIDGAGVVTVDGEDVVVEARHVVLINKGASRSIRAGNQGLSYLTIHRSSSGLTIGRPIVANTDDTERAVE